MLSEELIEYLKKHPKATILFEEDKHYGSMVKVEIEDFTFNNTTNRIILPNLCLCYEEPD